MKISQGKFEICTSKADAIDKLMQMQGVCAEKISDDSHIEFYCNRRGKIILCHITRRITLDDTSTKLYGEVVEQEGKTHVTYYTMFDKFSNITNVVFLLISLLLVILGVVLSVLSGKTFFLIIVPFWLLFLGYRLHKQINGKANSQKDSETLIKELEKRVQAVNLWDK